MEGFNKTLPTIITKEGKHLLVDKNGVIGGQIKSIVSNELINDKHNIHFESKAEITFQVNICKDLDEAIKNYIE